MVLTCADLEAVARRKERGGAPYGGRVSPLRTEQVRSRLATEYEIINRYLSPVVGIVNLGND